MGRQIRFDNFMEFDSSTLTTSFQTMRASGWGFPVFGIKLVNDSDVAAIISFNGSDDHEYIPAGSFFVWDFSSNTPDESGKQRKGAQVYLRGPAAGTGNIYAIGTYVRKT